MNAIALQAPQIIYLLLALAGLCAAAYLHGKPRKGKHNFWVHAAVRAAFIALLAWGGFFS